MGRLCRECESIAEEFVRPVTLGCVHEYVDELGRYCWEKDRLRLVRGSWSAPVTTNALLLPVSSKMTEWGRDVEFWTRGAEAGFPPRGSFSEWLRCSWADVVIVMATVVVAVGLGDFARVVLESCWEQGGERSLKLAVCVCECVCEQGIHYTRLKDSVSLVTYKLNQVEENHNDF